MLPIFKGNINSGFLKKDAINPAPKNKSKEIKKEDKILHLNKNKNLDLASLSLFFPILAEKYLVKVVPKPKSESTIIPSIIARAKEYIPKSSGMNVLMIIKVKINAPILEKIPAISEKNKFSNTIFFNDLLF